MTNKFSLAKSMLSCFQLNDAVWDLSARERLEQLGVIHGTVVILHIFFDMQSMSIA